MLARSFKTAAQLNITEMELSALKAVLGMLERGEIPHRKFSMQSTGDALFWKGEECGTPACICGWARHVTRNLAFDGSLRRYPRDLCNLFLMGADKRSLDAVEVIWPKITTAVAARALSNYLTTGEPRWSEAVAMLGED